MCFFFPSPSLMSQLNASARQSHTKCVCLAPLKKRTVGVGSLAQGEEVDDGVVHLQDSCTLPVHYCQTRPPAHRVVGQTAGQDNEGLPAKTPQKQREKTDVSAAGGSVGDVQPRDETVVGTG